jgi:hypothetical protein
MLKWKCYKFPTIANNTESLTDILGGAAGKTRRIKYIAGDIDSDIYLRLYRNAEQIVDLECDIPTSGNSLVPMDLPIVEGDLVKAGFYNLAASSVTPTIAIGYEET